MLLDKINTTLPSNSYFINAFLCTYTEKLFNPSQRTNETLEQKLSNNYLTRVKMENVEVAVGRSAPYSHTSSY